MPDHHRWCIKNKILSHQQCFVQKFLPYSIPRYFDLDIDDQIRRIDSKIRTVVDDGGMVCSGLNIQQQHRHAAQPLQYSLNKHKRWILPNLLQEAISTADFVLLSPELNVSSIRIQSALDYSAATKRTGVLSFASTALGSVRHVYPVGHTSSVNDLIWKGIAEGQRDAKLKDKQGTLSQRAKSTNLGLLYVFTGPDHDHSKHAKRGKYKRVTGRKPIWRWERSRWSRKERKSTMRAEICDDFTENVAELQEDSYAEAVVPRQKFDLEFLLSVTSVRAKHQRLLLCPNKTSSTPDPKSKKIFVETADATVVVVDGKSPAVETVTAGASAAQDSGRRTFRFPTETLLNSDRTISKHRSKPSLIGIYGSWSNESVPRIFFADVGFYVAVSVDLHDSLFGLECVVKGPDHWVNRLQDCTSVENLLRGILTPSESPDESEDTWVKRLFSTKYQSLSVVRYAASAMAVTSSVTIWNRVEGTCQVCCGIKVLVSNLCGHYACPDCWCEYIDFRIFGGSSGLPCLGLQCDEPVCPSLIASFCSWEVIRSWQLRQQDVVLAASSSPVLRCSTPNCMYVFEFEEFLNLKKQFLAECRRCKNRMCTSCRKSWHWPCPCKEAERYRNILRSSGDHLSRGLEATSTYVAQIKKCPGCKQPMEKESGCPSMRCLCGMHFCWTCARPWKEHYNENNEWQKCTKRRQQLEAVDIGEDVKLLWKEVAYKEAVTVRAKRQGLKRVNWNPAEYSALLYGYHVLEYIYALFSQTPSARHRGAVKQEVSRLRFFLQMLGERDSTARTIPIEERILKQVACLRLHFK